MIEKEMDQSDSRLYINGGSSPPSGSTDVCLRHPLGDPGVVSRVYAVGSVVEHLDSNLEASNTQNLGSFVILGFGIFGIRISMPPKLCFGDIGIRISEFLKLSISELSKFRVLETSSSNLGGPASGPCPGRSSNYEIFNTKPGRREKCIFVPFIFINKIKNVRFFFPHPNPLSFIPFTLSFIPPHSHSHSYPHIHTLTLIHIPTSSGRE